MVHFENFHDALVFACAQRKDNKTLPVATSILMPDPFRDEGEKDPEIVEELLYGAA